MTRKGHAARSKAKASPNNKNSTAPGTRTRNAKRGTNSTTPAKPSRLQPSEPLHMTTRRAASKAASNPANSVAGSVAGSVASANSRRSSLAESLQQDAPSDPENDRPAKRSRLSTAPDSPDDVLFDATIDATPSIEIQTPESHSAPGASRNTSSRKRKSRSSNASSDADSNAINGVTNGVGNKDHIDSLGKLPSSGRKTRKEAEPPPDSAEPPPELTDASTPPGSPDPNPEAAISQELQNVLPTATEDARAKSLKRLPGRRRQPHPNLNVEVNLRRQLSLKTGYRSVVKALKPVLDELASRGINLLETEADYHKQCPEYEVVTGQLGERLQSRIHDLEAARTLKSDQAHQMYEKAALLEREQFAHVVRGMQENMLLQMYHRLMQIEREREAEYGDATDDEDHIIVPPKQRKVGRKGPQEEWMPRKHISRSEPYMAVENAWDEQEKRQALGKARKKFMEANNEESFDDTIADHYGFATFTGPDRDVTMAHYDIETLAQAVQLVEEGTSRKATAGPAQDVRNLPLLAALCAEMPPLPLSKETEKPIKAPRIMTPARKLEPPRSPPSAASTAMSLETPRSSPMKLPSTVQPSRQVSTAPEPNGISSPKPKVHSEPPTKIYSNKITDLLNDEADPIPRRNREAKPWRAEELTPSSFSQRENVDTTRYPPTMNGLLRTDRLEEPTHLQPQRRKSSPALDQFWSSKNKTPRPGANEPTGEKALPEKNPLARIMNMIHATPKPSHPERSHERTISDVKDSQPPQREGSERLHMGPPSRLFAGHERSASGSGSDSRRTSINYNAGSPPNRHVTYSQSPHPQPAQHAMPPRPPTSMSHGPRHWEDHHRRASDPHGPPHPTQPVASPYGPPPQKPYAPNGPPRPPLHSGPPLPPFAHAHHHPPSQPPQPQAQPSTPFQNFRFAHWEGPPTSQPPRPAPAPPPTGYPPVSHPPQNPTGPPGPPTHQSPYPPPQGPLQGLPPQGPHAPHFAQPPYNGAPPPFHNYQPPPQGYQPQAPPPPHQPPPQYPPLKIHQYGGQPILPANMAPHTQPPVASPYQPTHPPAFSQQALPQPPPQAEQTPQSNRRKYRGYMGPGTEFRNYTGPNQPRQRRGG